MKMTGFNWVHWDGGLVYTVMNLWVLKTRGITCPSYSTQQSWMYDTETYRIIKKTAVAS